MMRMPGSQKGLRVKIILGCIVALAAVLPARADLLTPADRDIYRSAFESAAKGRWTDARITAVRAQEPLPGKVLAWLDMTRTGSTAPFSEISAFLAANTDWPRRHTLERRAEEALGGWVERDKMVAWLREHEPRTANGRAVAADLSLDEGNVVRATKLIRDAWIQGAFSREARAVFLARYRAYLRPEDHRARLDRLLWDGRYPEAQNMSRLVDEGYDKLAQARQAFRTGKGNVDALIRRVPASLQDDPGLLYDRFKWNLQKNRDEAALRILMQAQTQRTLPRAELWWTDRQRLARRLLSDGRITDAYKVVEAHRTTPGSSEYTEAEWLAGWIAFRFLSDNQTGLKHFTAMHSAVQTPISKSRGAYWAGRASEAMGQQASAREWYNRAAEQPTTYYGVLAAEKLNGTAPALPPEYQPTAAETAEFDKSELARVVRMMLEIGYPEHARPFLEHLAQSDGPARAVLASRLAHSLGWMDLGVVVARTALRTRGHVLSNQGYPLIKVPPDRPEPALVHAVGRQESNFDTNAVSGVGALGIMQLMPPTAKGLARQLGTTYSATQLTRDPAYNVRLGAAYLANLLDQYNGSYLLAIAAYNAGPGSVNQWLRYNGDPRQNMIDAIDWIEMIPFNETRNFVQRVLENLFVYRQRIDGRVPPRALAQELRR